MAQNTDALKNSGADSEQIRAEIERTRANMDDTFDALEAKLTPGQLLGEAWNLTKGGSTAGASKCAANIESSSRTLPPSITAASFSSPPPIP